MIKKYSQFEALDIKGKVEKIKKMIDDNKSIVDSNKKIPTHKNLNYEPPIYNFEGIFEDIKINFDPSYINDYIIYNFDKFCSRAEMMESGYTDEIKYYKEYSDSEDIEDAIIEEMWEYVVDKYGIDFDAIEYQDLKYLIEYYIQENFPFYNVCDLRF